MTESPVSICQEKRKNRLGIFKLPTLGEHLAEFIASSVLTAVMTYANRRLSAETGLFCKKPPKKQRHAMDGWKVEAEGGRKNEVQATDICCRWMRGKSNNIFFSEDV